MNKKMDIILATLKHNNILLKFKSIYFKENYLSVLFVSQWDLMG